MPRRSHKAHNPWRAGARYRRRHPHTRQPQAEWEATPFNRYIGPENTKTCRETYDISSAAMIKWKHERKVLLERLDRYESIQHIDEEATIMITNAAGEIGRVIIVEDPPKVYSQWKSNAKHLKKSIQFEKLKGNFYRAMVKTDLPEVERLNKELNDLWNVRLENIREQVEKGDLYIEIFNHVNVKHGEDPRIHGKNEGAYQAIADQMKRCYEYRKELIGLWKSNM